MIVEEENPIRALARQKLPSDKFDHSMRVARLASRQGHSYAVVGMMHDMLEDSDVTRDELISIGVTGDELAAIQLLTRGPESYEDYVQNIASSGNALAISVKICDLLDHLDPSLIDGLDQRKQDRYLGALPAVLCALRQVRYSD